MKNLVAILGGFLLTLGVFGGGALTTIFFVHAKSTPAHSLDGDTGALWTNKAVVVDADARDLERLPARSAPQRPGKETQIRDSSREPGLAGNPNPALDTTATAAISPEAARQPVAAANAAHVHWCSQRYRSYNPADNSYNSYSGVRRECISPYSEAATNADEPVSDEAEQVQASAEGAPTLVSGAAEDMSGAISPEHVQSCFDRYRSYQPEDNSYQPYGGGPRQQCQ